MIRQQTCPSLPGAWSTRILAACALVAVCGMPWVKLQLTASAPRGVWVLSQVPAALARDMWVTLPVPLVMARWGPRWTPLLKPVAAVAGESVCVQDATLWIRGRNYGPVYTQAQGEPLPHLADGCVEIEAGRVFLASPAPQSLDGRYFASVAITDLAALATPVLVWR